MYRVKAEIVEILPDGTERTIAEEAETVAGAVEVRQALQRATTEADRTWRLHSWEKEQHRQ